MRENCGSRLNWFQILFIVREGEREKDFSNGESGTILNLHTWITFFSVEHLATKYTNMFNFSSLKGQCQEDFAVLGQFCA